jgi:hypothetical protein
LWVNEILLTKRNEILLMEAHKLPIKAEGELIEYYDDKEEKFVYQAFVMFDTIKFGAEIAYDDWQDFDMEDFSDVDMKFVQEAERFPRTVMDG